MAEKLFVAGVSWSTTDDSFKDCFTKFGEVTECQIMKEPSGRSRGFGFVVFANEETNAKVLNQQIQLDGRKLDIKPAVAKDELQSKSAAPQPDSKKVWVAGLSYDSTDDALFNIFAQFGEVEKASIMRDKITGKSRGFGFVSFTAQESADTALKATDLELDGRKLDLKPAVPRGVSVTGQIKKVFVAGMLETTTEETMKDHFSQFGTVTELSIQTKAGVSRGFGFVTFEDSAAASAAIAAEHNLDGKKVDCKAAVPRGNAPGAPGAPGAMRFPPVGAAMAQMAAARQYQLQFQAQAMQQAQAQAQAQAQVQAAYVAAARAQPVQPSQAFPGQYNPAAAAQAAQAFAMNPSINPSMNPASTMGNPTMNQAMANGSTTPGYPASYSNPSVPAYAGGAQPPQSYAAYGQDQSSRMPEGRGGYSVNDNVYAQQSARPASSANDPYSQAYPSYGEDQSYAQYGRHPKNRTVGYHPYSRV